MDIAPDALDLMTRTLLGEADQTPEGWQALANVIKNPGQFERLGAEHSGRSGDQRSEAICGVEPRQTECRPGAGNFDYRPELSARAAMVLQQVFNDQLPDNTGGATHYYAP